jgi:signal transduction histidine kinase
LTTLRLYLDMLNGGMVKEEAQKTEYLQTLFGETERLNRLVANVLDFSRLERQRPRLEKTKVPVAELLEQVRGSWESHCHNSSKELVVDGTMAGDAVLATDVKLAQQVLGNLIDNACKYSRDAADPRLWLRARTVGRWLLLEVEDRGPGVPQRERGTIFRAFRRGGGADVKAGGVGLGLALARQWAELLGGSLSLGAGQNGSGACFRLELPLS